MVDPNVLSPRSSQSAGQVGIVKQPTDVVGELGRAPTNQEFFARTCIQPFCPLLGADHWYSKRHCFQDFVLDADLHGHRANGERRVAQSITHAWHTAGDRDSLIPAQRLHYWRRTTSDNSQANVRVALSYEREYFLDEVEHSGDIRVIGHLAGEDQCRRFAPTGQGLEVLQIHPVRNDRNPSGRREIPQSPRVVWRCDSHPIESTH